MVKKKVEITRKAVFTIAIILSIILYLAGVFSGLYANKIIEKKTNDDINSLKTETEQNIKFLKNETQENMQYLQRYIDFLDLNLKSIQMDELFIETLDDEQKCKFSVITMNSLLDQLSFYWVNLPLRVEEYEKYNTLSPEYLTLKKQYTQLSINAWIIAKNKYDTCHLDILPILYFYSRDCDTCTLQGEELDRVRENAKDKKIIVFTIDVNSDEPMVRNVKIFYNITSVPALVVNNEAIQGRVFTQKEIDQRLQ